MCYKRRYRNEKTILKTALLLMVLLLTACTKDYKEDDIQKYIREEMGISSFSILEGPVEVEGDDGYTDRMWTVSTDAFALGEDFRIEEMTDESGRVYRHRIVCGLGRRADFEKGPIFVKAYREHANSYPTINDTVINLNFRGNDTGKARDRWLAGSDYSVFFDARMTDEETADRRGDGSLPGLLLCGLELLQCALRNALPDPGDGDGSWK